MNVYLIVGDMLSIRRIGGIIKSENRYPVYKNVRAKNKTEALYLLLNEMYEYTVVHSTSIPMYYFENMNATQII